MAFVRWHYRSGVYVRSHFRHTRRPRVDGQRPLLALVMIDHPRTSAPSRLPADAPARPTLHHFPSQIALQLRQA